MPKRFTSLANWLQNGSVQRSLTYQFYERKFFNLFMGAYKFNGITPQQQDFILKQFWCEGKISAFIVEGTKLIEGEVPKETNQYPNGMIAFAPFAPFIFDIYNWPIQVNLINIRGATFIPSEPQIVNKDVVIGYAQKSHNSVLSIVEHYLQKITDCELTIRVQLKSHKVPWLVATTPENEEKMKRLFDRVEADEEVLFITADEVEAIKSLQGGNTYIIDKLFQYKQALENELLTYLGFDNLGVLEKKEHMITDEVNSNNSLINDHSDNFLSCMQDFCDKIKEVFGYEISVEATSAPAEAEFTTNNGDEENE